ncbi:adenylyl-sulfate kinase [Paenibacillus nasutitermitis]|uniref:Adenylyl-sulfate kinase n=1 Tax=Paenibacillus nasutitermitis TaxID=1652958 RepID=A0A917DWP5_9BACL|nr:adenylyl-sulfate kinase [Paenibacillus nasutitermitis]GGD75987.1 adenylyl-sulfate kinase [Paenibacillus nasutitermitis]
MNTNPLPPAESYKSSNLTWHRSNVTREDRYRLNGHKSCALWLTGLSGSGKSTLAFALEKELYRRGVSSYVLDGDNIRQGLNRDLGFAPEDRTENIRRIGETSKLFVDAGMFVIAAFISPDEGDRASVRGRFAGGEFLEVYVKCSLQECERRDPKGLYKKAREGTIPNFTGISAPYDVPDKPDLVIDTEQFTLEESVEFLLSELGERDYLNV